MHTKIIKRVQKSLKELEINNKFRTPYQLLVHPSFLDGKMRSFEVLNKIFKKFKIYITDCTHSNIKNGFFTHCQIRNCKKGCYFFVDKFGKNENNKENEITNKLKEENNEETKNIVDKDFKYKEIHKCIKNILKKKNKFRYIILCSDKESIEDLLKLPKVPVLEVYGMNISLNTSSMNKKK